MGCDESADDEAGASETSGSRSSTDVDVWHSALGAPLEEGCAASNAWCSTTASADTPPRAGWEPPPEGPRGSGEEDGVAEAVEVTEGLVEEEEDVVSVVVAAAAVGAGWKDGTDGAEADGNRCSPRLWGVDSHTGGAVLVKDCEDNSQGGGRAIPDAPVR